MPPRSARGAASSAGGLDLTDLARCIAFVQTNPKIRTSKAGIRYEQYKGAKTIGEALQAGASRDDLRHDFKKGFWRFSDRPASSLVPAVLAAPRPPAAEPRPPAAEATPQRKRRRTSQRAESTSGQSGLVALQPPALPASSSSKQEATTHGAERALELLCMSAVGQQAEVPQPLVRLLKIFEDIEANPSIASFRSLSLDDEELQLELMCHTGAIDFLRAAGFANSGTQVLELSSSSDVAFLEAFSALRRCYANVSEHLAALAVLAECDDVSAAPAQSEPVGANEESSASAAGANGESSANAASASNPRNTAGANGESSASAAHVDDGAAAKNLVAPWGMESSGSCACGDDGIVKGAPSSASEQRSSSDTPAEVSNAERTETTAACAAPPRAALLLTSPPATGAAAAGEEIGSAAGASGELQGEESSGIAASADDSTVKSNAAPASDQRSFSITHADSAETFVNVPRADDGSAEAAAGFGVDASGRSAAWFAGEQVSSSVNGAGVDPALSSRSFTESAEDAAKPFCELDVGADIIRLRCVLGLISVKREVPDEDNVASCNGQAASSSSSSAACAIPAVEPQRDIRQMLLRPQGQDSARMEESQQKHGTEGAVQPGGENADFEAAQLASYEANVAEKQSRERRDRENVEQGDLSPCMALDKDFMESLLNNEAMFEWLESGEHRALLFHFLCLKDRSQKWYREAAQTFFREQQEHLISMLQQSEVPCDISGFLRDLTNRVEEAIYGMLPAGRFVPEIFAPKACASDDLGCVDVDVED